MIPFSHQSYLHPFSNPISPATDIRMRNLFNRVFGNLTDNSWYLVLEIFWASISASALSFVAA